MITNMVTIMMTLNNVMVDLVPWVERTAIELPKEGDREVSLVIIVKKKSHRMMKMLMTMKMMTRMMIILNCQRKVMGRSP